MILLNKSHSKLRRSRPFSVRGIQIALDITALAGVFLLSYLIRFDFSLPTDLFPLILAQLGLVVPLQFCFLRLFGTHRFIWRYVGITEINRILGAIAAAGIPLLVIRLFAFEPSGIAVVPLSVTIADIVLAFGAIAGLRIVRRQLYEYRSSGKPSRYAKKKRVLLVGAGRAGLMTLAELKTRRDLRFEIVGFVDDDPAKVGSVINGVAVLGKIEKVRDLLRDRHIDEAIITIANASREQMSGILSHLKDLPLRVRTIPSISELLDDKVTISRIRDVDVADLLGRTSVELDRESIEAFVADKIVMITGAGGSIGSELARQVLRHGASGLILVERSEFALFNIHREILNRGTACEVVPCLADVCDVRRMRSVFREHRPHVVFHAAAHKHVPMVEGNASEALKNNVIGTSTLGKLAGDFSVDSFVLISTDKAVNPTSVMGATKRMAELVVQSLNNSCSTRFVAVRFGNVIGSNGSVIPIFKEQIKAGGPVTVTHPDMTRYFMTIPEASQLVLQAGALGTGGEIFVLDMGEPVRIIDLARATIRLSGLSPDIDIDIVFTGMRPGEKLEEELQTGTERLLKTEHSKIFIGQIEPLAAAEIERALEVAEELSGVSEDTLIREFLSEMIPEANLRVDARRHKVSIIRPQRNNGKDKLDLAARASAV